MPPAVPDAENAAAWLRRARVRVIVQDDRTIVRLRGFSPAMAFIATLVVATVLIGFAFPLAAAVFSPRPVPPLLVAGTVAAAVAVAIFVARRRRVRIHSGCEDLVIDDARRTVSLPRTFGRDDETLLRIDRITEVAPAEDLSKLGDNLDAEAFGARRYRKKAASPGQDLPRVGHRSEMQYVVLVSWQDESGDHEAPIVKWSSHRRVRALTFWLRERLGLPVALDPD